MLRLQLDVGQDAEVARTTAQHSPEQVTIILNFCAVLNPAVVAICCNDLDGCDVVAKQPKPSAGVAIAVCEESGTNLSAPSLRGHMAILSVPTFQAATAHPLPTCVRVPAHMHLIPKSQCALGPIPCIRCEAGAGGAVKAMVGCVGVCSCLDMKMCGLWSRSGWRENLYILIGPMIQGPCWSL